MKEKENCFLCVNKMSLHHFDLQILKNVPVEMKVVVSQITNHMISMVFKLSFTDASSGSHTIRRLIQLDRSKVGVKNNIEAKTFKCSRGTYIKESAKNTSLYVVLL